MTDSEQRKVGRVPFVAEVEVSGVAVVRSTDLSIGGIYLEAVTTFDEGTVLDLRFCLDPGDPKTIEVKGRVLYCHERVGFGLAFENLLPEDAQRIADFVAANA